MIRGLDIGPKTIDQSKHISESDTVVWNGPMGVFESSFFEVEQNLLQIIATCTQNGLMSIMKFGDTASALKNLKIKCHIYLLVEAHQLSFYRKNLPAILPWRYNLKSPIVN